MLRFCFLRLTSYVSRLLRLSFRLDHGVVASCLRAGDLLDDSGRPADADLPDRRVLPEPEEDARVAGSQIALAGPDFAHLASPGGLENEPSPDSLPVRFPPLELEADPSAPPPVVAQELQRSAGVGDGDVEIAVVV